jgi:hypothetical protein
MCNFQTTHFSCGHSQPYTSEALCNQQQESHGKCAKETHQNVKMACRTCKKEGTWQEVDGEEEWVEDLEVGKVKGKKKKKKPKGNSDKNEKNIRGKKKAAKEVEKPPKEDAKAHV